MNFVESERNFVSPDFFSSANFHRILIHQGDGKNSFCTVYWDINYYKKLEKYTICVLNWISYDLSIKNF